MQVLKKQNEKLPFTDQKLPRFLIAEKQKTISKSITITGIGLHTGNNVSMTLNPAPPNTGFVFRIKKDKSTVFIKAIYSNVHSTELCTLLSDGNGNNISTVEHILSALHGLEIDNVYIDLDSDEVPVCDGSSIIFIKSLKKMVSNLKTTLKDSSK